MNVDAGFLSIISGAVMLSLVHAIMPDHWIPMVMIGKTEKWPRKEIFGLTALIAIPHIISTILIGIVIGIIGCTLTPAHEWMMGIAAPLVLVVIGGFYVFLDLNDFHQHSHDHAVPSGTPSRKSRWALLFPLATALFFSPCVAIGTYFFVAGTKGWVGIAIVSAIYLVVTVLGMVFMVGLGLRGVESITWSFLDRHENGVTGAVLVALGILIFFMEM